MDTSIRSASSLYPHHSSILILDFQQGCLNGLLDCWGCMFPVLDLPALEGRPFVGDGSLEVVDAPVTICVCSSRANAR